MSEFFWKYSGFDSLYVSQSGRSTRNIFALTGFIIFLCFAGAFISYSYVGNFLFENILFGIIPGCIFAFFILNFYRLALLTFSRYGSEGDKKIKPDSTSSFVKLAFMTLNILFLVYALELVIFQDKLNDLIASNALNDGLVSRLKLLITKIPGIHFLTVLLWIFFIWPLLARYFVPKYGSDYDELKSQSEAISIRINFNEFLNTYKFYIDKNSGGKASGIIYDMMVDPPFNTHFTKPAINDNGKEDLFTYLDNYQS
jgi:hypothetical protein